MKKCFTALLALCMLLTCTSAFAIDQHEPEYLEEQLKLMEENLASYWEAQGEGDVVKPYDEPITLRIVNYYTSNLENNMATWNSWWKETLENNRYAQACQRILNINLEYDWIVNNADNGYVTKMRLEMAASNLPDMWLITDQTDLLQLAASDLIIPVDDIIANTFTKEDQEIIHSDGGMLLEMATYEGQVYGIPRNISDTDTFSYIWLRKDWMEKLNLEAPKTTAELKALMDAFIAADFDGNGQKDTVGLALDSKLYYATRGLFAGFGAYPEFWVKDGEEIVWGGMQESTKKALAFLSDLYTGGYLDKEFITQSNTDALGTALAGRCGVFYGGHWAAHSLQNMLEKFPEAEWMCVELPSEDGAPVTQYLTPNKRGWVAINKNCKYPEAAGKISALCSFAYRSGITSGTFWMSNDNAQELQPFQSSVSSWDNYNTYLNLLQAFDSGDSSVLRGKAITYWGNMSSSSEWAWKHMFGDGPETPMVVLGNAITGGRINYDAFLGAPSEYMQDRWSAIKSEQLTAFTKIIIGEETVDAGFEKWLKTFDAMGGNKITQEVNDWYKSR